MEGEVTSDFSCAIVNTGRRPTGQLTLNKTVSGGPLQPEDFILTAAIEGESGPRTLATGGVITLEFPAGGNKKVVLSETGDPRGYDLTRIFCDNGSDVQFPENSGLGGTLELTIAPGDDVTCTYTNTFDGDDDRMSEETKRFVHRRVDNLLTHGPDRARMLRRLSDGAPQSAKDGPEPLGYTSAAPGGETGTQTLGATHEDTSRFGFAGPSSLGVTADTLDPITGLPVAGLSDAASNPTAPGSKTSNPFFEAIAGVGAQMLNASGSMKFGTSLSELRDLAVRQQQAEQQRKIEDGGLSFTGDYGLAPIAVPRPGFDIWIEGQYSRYNDGTGGVNREGEFGVLYVGADYVVTPGLLLGALVQFDQTREDLDQDLNNETGEIHGTGWMAGPYIGWRLAPELFLDVRAAYGTSDNDIWLKDDVAGYRSGNFETERWLATAALTGNYGFGAWRLSPELGLAYGYEEYDTYQNSVGQNVEGGDAKIGRVTGKMEVGYKTRASDGTTFEPHVAISGIWNFDTDKLVVNGSEVGTDESRALVEGGVIVTPADGRWKVRAAGKYDGIGNDDFESYGGSVWLSVPLN